MGKKVEPQPLITVHEEHYFDRGEFLCDPAWFVETTTIDARGREKKILPKPSYTVAEASKMFFGKTPDWMRWLSKKTDKHPDGFFILDGEPIEEHRTEHNFRYYTLADIEKMAHALAFNGVIDGAKCATIISLVKHSLRLYGYPVKGDN